jgi:hypothetical protein
MCPVGLSSKLLARRNCRYSTPFLFRVAAELKVNYVVVRPSSPAFAMVIRRVAIVVRRY